MSNPTNVGPQSTPGMTGPEFLPETPEGEAITAQGQAVVRDEDQLQQATAIGRPAEEVARDPANLAGALMLPAMTQQQMQAFLEQGLQWFEAVQDLQKAHESSTKIETDIMQKIISNMLDSWADSIKEIQEEKKRYENSPLRLMIEDQIKRLRTGEADANEAPASVATLMILMSVGGIGGEVESLKPVAQAWNAMAPFVASDMRAELGLLGAFYATMAQMQVAVLQPAIEKMAKDAAVKGTGKELAAKSYAILIGKEVMSPSFSLFLEHIVMAKLQGSMSPQDKEVLGAKVKIVLLMTALALLYKTETGKVTAEEVAGLLKGEVSLEKGDMRAMLAALIKGHIAMLPENQRTSILNALLEYVDSDPAVDDLLNPAEVFRGILGTSTFAPVKDQAI